MAPTVTVLMTAYAGTTVEELQRSVDCITAQTRPADEFLLVVDGPVPASLDAAIAEAASAHPELRVERLPVNRGSGVASARGLELATGEFLARHDSDDVSLPHRLERQLAVVEAHHLDLVGAAMLEFEGSPDHVVGVRTNPRTHDRIAARMRLNNPINNPTVVFRTQLARDVGGYADLPYMQDYDLFARMLVAGARMENLDEPLVLFNAGEGMLNRRGGWRMVPHELTVQRRLRDNGTIGTALFVRNLVLRSAFRIMPAGLLKRAYAVLFRREPAPPPAPPTPSTSARAGQ